MRQPVLVLLSLLAISGCAERRPPSPFTTLAREPLQAGIGLGELKLLQTTLGAFTRQFGLMQSVVTPEQGGAKIDFLKDGLTFMFRGNPECAQGLTENMGSDINAYLLQHPDCETMLLETIAAWIPASGDPLYEGETIEGIGLNAARAMAERAYKQTQDAVNALEMGTPMPEQEPVPPNEIRYPGIRLYMGRDANGNDVVRRMEVIPRQ